MALKKKQEEQQKTTTGAGDATSSSTGAENVLVTSGIHRGKFAVGGLKVKEARQTLSKLLSIDPKAVCVINGAVVDEETVIGKVEMIAFVKPSAVKGNPKVAVKKKTDKVVIDGDQVQVGDATYSLERLAQVLSFGTVQGGEELLPDHVRFMVRLGRVKVAVIEFSPCLRMIRWVADDSPVPYGPNAKYVERKLATPYVVMCIPFITQNDGRDHIGNGTEIFYRNAPLASLDDELLHTNLLNVSPNSHNCVSWFCTQYLGAEGVTHGISPVLNAVAHHLWGGGFNHSSEHAEGMSGFTLHQKQCWDKRVCDVHKWEAASQKDPRFVLTVPWVPAQVTVRNIVNSLFKKCGAAALPNSTAIATQLLKG